MLTAKWLNIITAFGVFIATINIKLHLSEKFGVGERVLIVFSIALLFAGIYETTVKPRRKLGFSNTRIILEVVIVWLLPMLIGYTLVTVFK